MKHGVERALSPCSDQNRIRPVFNEVALEGPKIPTISADCQPFMIYSWTLFFNCSTFLDTIFCKLINSQLLSKAFFTPLTCCQLKYLVAPAFPYSHHTFFSAFCCPSFNFETCCRHKTQTDPLHPHKEVNYITLNIQHAYSIHFT